MKAPTISVVIPTYGRPAMLSEAIASVLASDDGDVEVVVADDHPTISAAESKWCLEDERVRIVRSGPSSGGGGAKTVGARAARGRVLVFLDDDDLLCKDACSRIRAAYDETPAIDVLYLAVSCFGAGAAVTEAGHNRATEALLARNVTGTSPGGVILLGPDLAASLFEAIPVSFQNFAVTARCFERLGGFRSDFLLWDNEWSIRAALDYRVAFLPGPSYQWRLGDQNLFSRGERQLAQDEGMVAYLESLREHPRIRASTRLTRELEVALSNALYHVARGHLRQGRAARGMSALIASQRRMHVLRRWLTLGRMIVRES
jgi:glycosyltransferase involved in cell wall biosynthesis